MSDVLDVDMENQIVTLYCHTCEEVKGGLYLSSWRVGSDKSKQDIFHKRHQWCNISYDWFLYELKDYNVVPRSEKDHTFLKKCKEQGMDVDVAVKKYNAKPKEDWKKDLPSIVQSAIDIFDVPRYAVDHKELDKSLQNVENRNHKNDSKKIEKD